MRVAVIHNLPPGGARRRLAAQVTALGADVVEICPSTATPVTDDPVLVACPQAARRAPRAMRPPLRYADAALLLDAWRRVARALERHDVEVIYANPCMILGAPAALLFVDRPSLYFCDEPRRVDYEPRARERYNSATRCVYAPLRGAQRLLDRAATARADRIVTNSRYTAGRIAATYGREARPIPLGVPRSFRSCGEPRGDHLLSVGTLIPDKGHDLVIRAAAAAGRRPVVVVAPRPDPAGRERLVRLASRERVPLRVLVGISDEELRRLYSTAFATLYLARAEPFGLASVEAQACGCPVVVAAEGGLAETVDPGRTGFAVPRERDAVVAAIAALEDGARWASFSRAAAERTRELTWAQSAQRIADELDQLASAPTRKRRVSRRARSRPPTA